MPRRSYAFSSRSCFAEKRASMPMSANARRSMPAGFSTAGIFALPSRSLNPLEAGVAHGLERDARDLGTLDRDELLRIEDVA